MVSSPIFPAIPRGKLAFLPENPRPTPGENSSLGAGRGGEGKTGQLPYKIPGSPPKRGIPQGNICLPGIPSGKRGELRGKTPAWGLHPQGGIASPGEFKQIGANRGVSGRTIHVSPKDPQGYSSPHFPLGQISSHGGADKFS